MSREEFEQWVEDHKDEAIDRIEATELPLKEWVKLFGKSLTLLHNEEGNVAEDDLDDLSY